MSGKLLIGSALGTAIALAFVPAAASAQSLGIYVGPSYPAYRYYEPRPSYYDDDRRQAWLDRQRWEQRRWAQEDARRRYWQRERWEHRGDWHDDDDD